VKNFLLATATVLSLAAGTSLHAAAKNGGGSSLNGGLGAGNGGLGSGTFTHSDAGQSVLTGRSRGVVTTGRVGNMYTTTLPGGSGQGILTNNGNGTSTLVGPDGVRSVQTPR
jgi:hypothetical protein